MELPPILVIREKIREKLVNLANATKCGSPHYSLSEASRSYDEIMSLLDDLGKLA